MVVVARLSIRPDSEDVKLSDVERQIGTMQGFAGRCRPEVHMTRVTARLWTKGALSGLATAATYD